MNRAARRDASHRTLMGSFLRMVLLFVPIVLCITITVFLYAERTIAGKGFDGYAEAIAYLASRPRG